MIKELGINWQINVEQKILDTFFEKHISLFPNSAGDIETLIFSIKMEHARRVFCSDPSERRKITEVDINNALRTYIENKEKKVKVKKSDFNMMYI